MTKKLVSLVIPCFNEELVLDELFKRTGAAIAGIKDKDLNFEVIMIDDGSKDGTLNLIKKQSELDSRYKFVSFSRNFGHQAAVSCGLKYSKGDAVIVLDADLQDPPEVIFKYIEKWREGYQVVYAIRTNRKENFIKKFFYWLFYRFLKSIVEIDIPLDSGDFSLMDRKVVDIINSMPERNRFIRGMRSWTGFSQIGVPYERDARLNGNSKYTIKKLLKLGMDGVISFSTFPLTLCINIGVFIFIISLLGILFTFIQRIFSDYFSSIGLAPSPGFATIVISILFLGGIQLFFMGILGSYIVRIFDEVKARPSWVIKDQKGLNEKKIVNTY